MDAALAPDHIRELVCQSCWTDLFSTTEYWKICSLDDDGPKRQPNRSARHRMLRSQAAVNADSCNWCSLIDQLLQLDSDVGGTDKSKRPAHDIHLGHQIDKFPHSTPPGNNTWAISMTVPSEAPTEWHLVDAHTGSDDEAASSVTARPIQYDVNTEYAVSQIKSWLKSCETHADCPDQRETQLPTRVIYVGSKLDSTLPKLHVSHGEHAKYAALAYCWGGPQRGTLTQQNLPQYLEALDMDETSQTIRDAIHVVRASGLRYLWVDALCIIQDNETDKSQEISKMDHIYTSALFTIVAQSASSAEQGFLSLRSPPPTSYKLPFCCSNGGFGTMSVTYRGATMKFIPILGTRLAKSYFRTPGPETRLHHTIAFNQNSELTTISKLPMSVEPLEHRAWAFQESLLSPRLLIYNSITLRWFCRGGEYNLGSSYCEIDHQHDTLSTRGDFDKLRSANKRYEISGIDHWHNLVRHYSARKLTSPADRLLALGGVAKTLAEANHSRYLAGLWEDALPQQLLWQSDAGNFDMDDDEEPGDMNRCSRLMVYKAPSWSWASIDKEVSFVGSGAPAIAKILQCEIFPASNSGPFGALQSGWLVIESYLCRGYYFATFDSEKLGWSGHNIRWKGTPGFLETTMTTSITGTPQDFQNERRWKILFDTAHGTATTATPLAAPVDFLVICGKEKFSKRSGCLREITGLVLQDLADGTHKRIGVFHSVEDGDDDGISLPDFPESLMRIVKII